MGKTREVAVGLFWSRASNSCLVVSSRRHKGKAVFPKGGIEKGENAAEAAEREAWEEAGLIQGHATHVAHIVKLDSAEASSPNDSLAAAFVPKTRFAFELFMLEDASDGQAHAHLLADDWPEADERIREWVKVDKLEEVLAWGKREHIMRSAIRQAIEVIERHAASLDSK